MMEQTEKFVRAFDWITLAAVLLGPIFAVFVTRYIDEKREKRSKRLELFKTLMRTRGQRTLPEHVGALNLIEVEYYKEEKVLNTLERYLQHLNNLKSSDIIDKDAMGKWVKDSEHLFTKLLYEVAKSLGYEIEQLQILSGGYYPQGWVNNEQKQIEIQEKLLSFLKGEVPLPICGNPSSRPEFQVPPNHPMPPV